MEIQTRRVIKQRIRFTFALLFFASLAMIAVSLRPMNHLECMLVIIPFGFGTFSAGYFWWLYVSDQMRNQKFSPKVYALIKGRGLRKVVLLFNSIALGIFLFNQLAISKEVMTIPFMIHTFVTFLIIDELASMAAQKDFDRIEKMERTSTDELRPE